MAYILRYKPEYLYNFIDFININNTVSQENIDKKYYSDSKVEREEGKIDILIKSEETRHCIIIENKINNARDMDRQLPKYFIKQKDRGFIIPESVYL
ncbi:hypothetical protein FACS1894137_19320 [Spirochaetia bacterium]|nr:hypothetical protein FACS1894137_19320 [Spirochaetia bacterium]